MGLFTIIVHPTIGEIQVKFGEDSEERLYDCCETYKLNEQLPFPPDPTDPENQYPVDGVYIGLSEHWKPDYDDSPIGPALRAFLDGEIDPATFYETHYRDYEDSRQSFAWVVVVKNHQVVAVEPLDDGADMDEIAKRYKVNKK